MEQQSRWLGLTLPVWLSGHADIKLGAARGWRRCCASDDSQPPGRSTGRCGDIFVLSKSKSNYQSKSKIEILHSNFEDTGMMTRAREGFEAAP